MVKFKKAYNFKIVSVLIVAIFFLTNTVYGIDLPKKTHLRSHLMGNSESEIERLKETLSKFTRHKYVNQQIAEQAKRAYKRFLQGRGGIKEDKKNGFYKTLDKYNGIAILPIDNLYAHTGILEHIGLGRCYGKPIIYIDSSLKGEDREQVLHHAYDEITKWTTKKESLVLEWHEMRAHILENYEELEEFAKETHKDSYPINHILEKYEAEHKSNLLDIIAMLPFKEGDIVIAAGEPITRRNFLVRKLVPGVAAFAYASLDDRAQAKPAVPIEHRALSDSGPMVEVNRLLGIIGNMEKGEPERVTACEELYDFIRERSKSVRMYVSTLDKKIDYKYLFSKLLQLYTTQQETLWDLKFEIGAILSLLQYLYLEYDETFSHDEKLQIVKDISALLDWMVEGKHINKIDPVKIERFFSRFLYFCLSMRNDPEMPALLKLSLLRLFLEKFINYLPHLSTIDRFEYYFYIIALYINDCHDLGSEGDNFREEFCSNLTSHQLNFILTYAGHHLTTSSYNLLFKRLVEIIKTEYNNSLYSYIKELIPNKRVQKKFVLSLALRGDLKVFVGSDAKFSGFLEDLIRETLNSFDGSKGQEDDLGSITYLVEQIVTSWWTFIIKQKVEKIILDLYGSANSIIAEIIIEKIGSSFSPENRILLPKVPKRLTLYEYPRYEEWIRSTVIREGVIKERALHSYVNFLPSAEFYLEELKKLLLKRGFHVVRKPFGLKDIDRRYPKVMLEKEIDGIKSRVILAFDAPPDEMRKIIEHPDISFVHTRHHSYEEGKTIGIGSGKVLPFFILTKNVAEGVENNYMFALLLEAIAEGSKRNWTWDDIYNSIQPRLRGTIQNYIFPNHLTLLMRQFYGSRPSAEKAELTKLLFPGGCGSLDRVQGLRKNYNLDYPFPRSTGGSPSECLRTFYSEFKDTQVHIKDLIKRRLKQEGGHYKKTAVYTELKYLIKLNLVKRVKGKRGYCRLTNFARDLTLRQLDFICDIEELNHYEIKRGKVQSTKNKVYHKIQNFSWLRAKVVFFLGDEVRSNPEGFKKALQKLRSDKIPVVLAEDNADKEKLTREINSDVTLSALLRRLKLKVMTFEEAGIDRAKVNSYKMQILGIDDIHCIPLTPVKFRLHPGLREAERNV